MPSVTPKPVKTSSNARDMLRFDLGNENETIINYQERVRQCEALGEFAMAEQIREILVQEQDHQIDLATARSARRSRMSADCASAKADAQEQAGVFTKRGAIGTKEE